MASTGIVQTVILFARPATHTEGLEWDLFHICRTCNRPRAVVRI